MTPKELHARLIEFKGNYNSINIDFKKYPMIKFPGFFPYCNGSFNNSDTIDYKIQENCILILGQDFGNIDRNYCSAEKKNGEEKNATFFNLKNFIKKSKLDSFFLSNILIGLRKNGRAIGPNPEKNNSDYINNCLRFFKIQVEELEPKAIICLGKETHSILANNLSSRKYSIELKQNSITTFKKYYQNIESESIITLNNKIIPLIAIPHPCYGVNLTTGKKFFPAWVEEIF